jgi:hypothetical protein
MRDGPAEPHRPCAPAAIPASAQPASAATFIHSQPPPSQPVRTSLLSPGKGVPVTGPSIGLPGFHSLGAAPATFRFR